jgi:RNA polymerase sigma-32 factor
MSNSLGAYGRAAKRFPKLTLKQEQELQVKARAGDIKARDTLLNSNLRHVISIATQFLRYGIPIEDLVSDGNEGIMHAVRKYEPEKNYKFITYACFWIRVYMQDDIVRTWSLVGKGIPFRSEKFYKVRREHSRAQCLSNERDEIFRIISERTGIAASKVAAALTALRRGDVDIERPLSNEENATRFIDTLVDDSPLADDEVDSSRRDARLRAQISRSLNVLDNRELYIVQRRLMAIGDDQMTLESIGKQFRVTRERVRQVEKRAVKKLRTTLSHLRGIYAEA